MQTLMINRVFYELVILLVTGINAALSDLP